MGATIVDGRGLEPADTGRQVIVINETMARQFWPGRRAVGQRIVCTPPESGWNISGELEIVGVGQDSFMTSMAEVQPTVFQPADASRAAERAGGQPRRRRRHRRDRVRASIRRFACACSR